MGQRFKEMNGDIMRTKTLRRQMRKRCRGRNRDRMRIKTIKTCKESN
jgi:hypothetical protein